MTRDATVESLLEEILASNRSVEEICADHPQLKSEVHKRLRKIYGLAAQIDQMFPEGDSSVTEEASSVGDTRTDLESADLPEIPGYAVEAILGYGGMGVVYQARQLGLNRSVAVKMLLSGPHASKMELLRFAREAEAIAGLHHPNIVQIYDVGDAGGRPYYTMELVAGGTLTQKLKDQQVSVREVAETLVLLAGAVQSAHVGGIVHRDLKPSNILLDLDGTPKISDFGLARRVDLDVGMTLTGARMGTPSYMAPEQVCGESIGPAVDIYALGTVLYAMLTGDPPFRGDSIIETENRLISEDPQPPSQLNAHVPQDLETICLKCLQKAPASRYPSAEDLANDLNRFLRYEPIEARPISRIGRGLRWIRRSPAQAALIVTALALGAMFTIYGTRELALSAGRRAEKARLTARLESGLELERQGRYAETRALLGKLGDGGHQDLRERIDRAVAKLDIVEELDSLAIRRIAVVQGRYDMQENRAQADARYKVLFSQLEIGGPCEHPNVVAEHVKSSDFKSSLLAALDDWAVCASDPHRREWILEVARLSDHDPTGVRDRIRDPKTWLDPDVLLELSESAIEANAPVRLLLCIGERIALAGLDTIDFRTQVQRAHADDFLVNFSLAEELDNNNPAEASRYYQAALAIQPDASPALNNLGQAMLKLGRTVEAIGFFEAALQIEPRFALARLNLGQALVIAGRIEESIPQFQQAVTIDPSFALAHGALGETLSKSNRLAEARQSLQKCLQLLPADAPQRPRYEALLD